MMQVTRQHVVDLLHRTGFQEAADKAVQELPDPVDVDQVVTWGAKYGVSHDALVSQMGGSP
jgi:hypothetical protein